MTRSRLLYRGVELPGHALLGTIVKVEAVVYERANVASKIDPKYLPSVIRLTFSDGRGVDLQAEGYEADGIGVTEDSQPLPRDDYGRTVRED